ncbi:hypothetical protein FZC78_10225 [Rossellomorea vietnamensis]|uniref:Uncharacterized protein n=1 Tax=Rossellomorea vietnamensis TaxID=218284 RepID=A0A5D4NU65_9BACI|nr:hypothetical protein [Rossellomorea vietnamensis]TYS16998.1 hypothetical protein FZC78_10225 [Rossellomorea vietnamensis]
MLWASIFSILLIAGILVLVFFLAKPASKIFLKGRRGNWVFGSYLALLSAGAVISYLVPKDSFEFEPLTAEEMKVQENINEQFYNLAWKGRIDEAEGVVAQKSWELKYEGEELMVPYENGDYYISVLVEKTETNDDTINAGYYTGTAYIDNLDVTSKVPSPELRIEDGTLQIIPPFPVEVKVAKTAYPHPFHQFTDGYKMFDENRGSFFGMEMIYLRVPSNVKVNGNVEYIER